MKTHIETIAQFLTSQMDGEQVPPHNSPALARLFEAVAAIHKAGDNDLQLLALRTVGAVIDRVSSNIQAEKTLRQFITGGDHA